MTPTGHRPPFSKTAPNGLAAPDDMVAILEGKDRVSYVLEHGFTKGELKPGWWLRAGVEIGLPGGTSSEPKLTRADLFEMSNQAADDDGALLDFLWHVLAWGSGPSRRNNRQRMESCKENVTLLRKGFAYARAGDPRAAYSALVRPGKAAIRSFGPAFFSKFLYFASEGVPSRCLILDARVARSMHGLGWSMAPTYPTKTFSYNWYTDTYVSYCDLLQAWREDAGDGISPDMFERALFEGGS